MRVAMLTYFGEEGGVYTHVKNICNEITKFPNIEIHIVTLGRENRIIRQFGATLHFIKKINFPGNTYFYSLSFMKKIKEINPDILHVQGYSRYYFLALALMKKYPTIVTIHANYTEELIHRLEPSLKRSIALKIDPYLEKLLLRRALFIIAVNPYIKNYIKEKSSNSKIVLIPNGVDLKELSDCFQIDLLHPSLLFVGRLEKVKGLDILIRAVLKVRMSIPNIHLYIAGSGSEENRLKELVRKLNIQNNITFLGFISGNKKWSYYKSTDLFVLPSRHEVFPITLLEAMALGKPIIASKVGGIPYLVENGKNGLLFECGNVDDLAEKIIILLQDTKLQEKMSKIGQEKAKEFSWDRIVNKTLNLYREVFVDKCRHKFH